MRKVLVNSTRNGSTELKFGSETQLLSSATELCELGKASLNENAFFFIGRGSTYTPCFNCEKHPKYPDVPPITLHLGKRCFICGK